MSGPWEEYAQPDGQEAGPWMDYRAPQPERAAGQDASDKRRGDKSVMRKIDAGVRGAADMLTFGFADEASAAVNSLFNGKPYAENLAGERAIDTADAEQVPVSRGVGQGAGFVAGMGAGAVIDAGRLAPNALRTGGGLAGRLGRAAGGGAVVGGLSGAGAADGDIGNRAGSAILPAIAGGAVGLASVPIAAGVGAGFNALARRGAAPIERAANALRARTNVPEAQARANALRVGGAVPSFVSATDQAGRGYVAAAANRMTPGREIVQQRAEAAALDLPDRISRQARRHITDDDRSVPDVEASIDDFIRTTATPPEVSPGYAGMVTSQKLNANRDAAWNEVNAAYSAAREMGPTGAHLPMSERPRIAADMREAVAGYAAENVPRVTNVLKALDSTGTLTVDDMFNMRTQLSNLRVSGDPVEASAAAKAVGRLDQIIDDAHDNGIITGNADVVGAYKMANTKRRAFGQNFEGEDMIHALTDRTWRGDGGKQVKIAPEDAGFAIFGRGQGVSNRPNLTRDLITMRNRLGADSPEWTAIQQEGLARILGRDAGAPNYGAGLETFRRSNPDLAEVLVSPQQAARVRQARGDIRGAVLDQNAIRLGKNFTATGTADEFTRNASATTPERNALARLSAVRDVEAKAGENGSSAPGLARKLAYAPEQQARNAALLGPDGAKALQTGMAAEARVVRDYSDVAPRNGSKTALTTADQDTVANVAATGQTISRNGMDPVKWMGTALESLKKLGLSDADAHVVADIATDPAQLDDLLRRIARQPGGQAFVEPIRRALAQAGERDAGVRTAPAVEVTVEGMPGVRGSAY